MAVKKSKKSIKMTCKELPIGKDNLKYFYDFMSKYQGMPLAKKPRCANHIFQAAAVGSPTGWKFIDLIEPLLRADEDAVFCIQEDLKCQALIGINGETLQLSVQLTPDNLTNVAKKIGAILKKKNDDTVSKEKAAVKKGLKGWKTEKSNNEYLDKYEKMAKSTAKMLYKHLRAHTVYYETPALEEAAKKLRGALNMNVGHNDEAIALLRNTGKVSTLFVSRKKGKKVAKIYFNMPSGKDNAARSIKNLIPQVTAFLG